MKQFISYIRLSVFIFFNLITEIGDMLSNINGLIEYIIYFDVIAGVDASRSEMTSMVVASVNTQALWWKEDPLAVSPLTLSL